ncbi:hypothetical protein GCM10009640_19840 [Agrococcus citreus]|uniref:HTH araC/xylS-type domain-containing protein n=2 Tax=Agrococcus citreus TaxID=84643 RepID=A0ABP4JKG6_9MICO
MVASAVVAVVAAIFVARPPWGVPAAVVLALGAVGVAAGLLLQRRGAARAEVSHDGIVRWTAVRERRAALLYGGFLLVASAATGVGLLLPGVDSELMPAHAWAMIGVLGVCGAVVLGLGLLRTPAAVTARERPTEEPVVDAAGWMRLGPRGPALDPRALTSSLFAVQLAQAPLLLVGLLPVVLDLGPSAVVAAIAVAVLTVVTVTLVVARRARPAWIAPDGSAIRQGSRTVPAAEVAWASLSPMPLAPDATARSLALALGFQRRGRATMHLRRRGRLALSERETVALLALVERSSIELPHDAHDPTGRFSKSFHPNHLTKAEALAVVAHPPGDGEALPIASG